MVTGQLIRHNSLYFTRFNSLLNNALLYCCRMTIILYKKANFPNFPKYKRNLALVNYPKGFS